MEINSLFGLPAHPLFVHAAVVLLPLSAISLIAVAFFPKARRTYGPFVFGLSLVATIAVGLAQSSGEEFEEQVKETELVEEHSEQGEIVLPWAVATTAIAAFVVLADPLARRLERQPPHQVVSAVLLVGALAAGIGATVSVIQVGHSGAKATWENLEK